MIAVALKQIHRATLQEGKVRRAPHHPAEAPTAGFDEKKDFQLARALDVLKYGSVAATPKLPTPKPRLAALLAPKGPTITPPVKPSVSTPPEKTPAHP